MELDRTMAARSGPQGGREGPDEDNDLAPGTLVGRYVLLGQVGTGNMGVVHAAHDPDLDRRVAVKLIRAREQAGAGTSGGTRLLREAQALARVSHPNIVAVYDVGVRGTQVWIAMEFVAGLTLRDWAATPRSQAELLRALTESARGVAAAHAAGVVHRDLKPDNVMIDDEQRVRVMDFGLAHGRGASPARSSATWSGVAATALETSALSARLTQFGSLPGTPAYMAPEQWRGEDADAASDQFGWCVMAWELLHGERPFAGDTVAELGLAVLAGRHRAAPRSPRVPRWLRAILERGLATAPNQRWPSMAALVDALEHGKRRVRVHRLAAALATVGLLAAGVAGAHQLDIDRRVQACEREGDVILGVWDDQARARVRDALLATGVSYAGSTAEKVAPWLDERTEAWTRTRTEVCLDATVRETVDPALLVRANGCLDDRLMELESLVAELGRADATTVRRSVGAVAALKDPALCSDQALLLRRPPLPAFGSERLQALRAELARAASRSVTGHVKDALKLAQAARARASALAWPALLAAALALEGNLLEKTGAYDEAESVSTAAYFTAASVGAWDVAANAAVDLIYIIGHRKGRHADALVWSRHAEVALMHGGDRDGLTEASRLGNLATAHLGASAHAEALRLNERALALREQRLGAEHPDVARGLNNLALTHYLQGSYKAAQQLHERALAIRERTLGSEHLDVAESLNNLAAAHHSAGANTQALALYKRSLAIRERALGPDDLIVATTLANVALIHVEAERPDAALPLFERVLAIQEKALGPDDHNLAATLVNLADLHRRIGALATARTLAERAVRIHEQALGPDHPGGIAGLMCLAAVLKELDARADASALLLRVRTLHEATPGPPHPDLANTLALLAELRAADGLLTEALALHDRALEIREQALGPDHVDVASSLFGRAEVQVAANAPATALPSLERALAILERHAEPHALRPVVELRLAQVLLATGGARDRALALARRARDGEAAAGPRRAAALAEVEQWLLAHAAP